MPLKKVTLPILLLVWLSIGLTAAPPVRLFDVRQGDGAVLGETYANATLVVFRDASAKTAIVQDFAEVYRYPATVTCTAPGVPVVGCALGEQVANPQNKQGFFRDKIKEFIKRTHSEAAVIAAMNAARTTAENDVPPE